MPRNAKMVHNAFVETIHTRAFASQGGLELTVTSTLMNVTRPHASMVLIVLTWSTNTTARVNRALSEKGTNIFFSMIKLP